jgi:hypothetical protein
VRDAFADLLFPGTSTIQTRAKYFLFVPWIYQHLEDKRTSSANVTNRARKLESELMLALEQSGDDSGLIGKLAKENVRRLASSVYWLGLATWGIRVFLGSQGQYHRSLDLFYVQRQGRRTRPHEFDGESQAEADLHNWHAGLPHAPSSFPQGVSFALSRKEAEYLRERVLTNCPRTLLAHILLERPPIEAVPNCWDLVSIVPLTLREQLTHGQNFSEVMHGAQLLYNLMLAELRPWPAKSAEYQSLLVDWWALISARRNELGRWDRQRFWQIVRMGNPRVSLRAQAFVNQWIELLLGTSDSDGIVNGQGARNLVGDREQALKRGQSRLHNRRALELWNGAAGADQMDLRWTAARRILSDILIGLKEVDDA